MKLAVQNLLRVGAVSWLLASGLSAAQTSDMAAAKEPKDSSGDITVAWITALATVSAAVVAALAAVFSAVWAQRERKRAEQLEQGSRNLGKDLQTQLLERYGFRAESTLVKVEILNKEGDAIITRSLKGIEIVQDVTLTSIPVKSWVDSPQGRLECPPTLLAASSDGGPFPKEVSLVPVEEAEKTCYYAIEVTGALTRQDPRLDISTRLKIYAAYIMTFEELATAYKESPFKREYHSSSVDFPTKTLELEVHFPPDFQTKAFPGVFLLGTEFVHASELNRVSKGFQELEGGARLKVQEPLLGFTYLIYWAPPRKAPARAS